MIHCVSRVDKFSFEIVFLSKADRLKMAHVLTKASQSLGFVCILPPQ